MLLMLAWLFCQELPSFTTAEPEAEIQFWETWLLQERADQTDQSLMRSRGVAPRLKEVFRKQGVPADLIWLVLIESGFRNGVESPTGAVGMFQFKKETARFLGLRTEKPDERRDPYRAAEASARYLKYLFEKFQDWDLVLAAYNLGEGDLARSMAREKATTWLQIKPHIRIETQNYVAKIHAAVRIGNRFWEMDPRAHAEWPEHRVRVGETLYAISKQYGVDLTELMAINGLQEPIIQPEQVLFIPLPKADRNLP
ncbi:MAG: transglycosylase SLT domain-containing protein [Acidobacteria bacterium]|nr:transglycosylase SLT domain-containing protein [Acidobacteriota bacterium]MCB9397360.1 transglycosylase SLT domain-containing protein [Acidobacteriota bacterium]